MLDRKLLLIGGVTVLFVGSLAIYPLLGTELFPTTDAGKFIIKLETPVGTRIELTTKMAQDINRIIHQLIPPYDLKTVVANLGVVPNISAIYTSNSGEDTGEIMVDLQPDHRRSTFYYERVVKRALDERLPEVHTFFTSGSIIDAVMNFGSAAPIDVQLSGPMIEPYSKMFRFAHVVASAIRPLHEVQQTWIPQIADYPTLNVKVDRVRAARLGITERAVVTNLLTAITNNEMIKPSIWIDPRSGDDYYLTAQYDESAINSVETLLDVPVGMRRDPRDYYRGFGHEQSILLRDVATIVHEHYPSEAGHYNIQRVVDVLVEPSTSDLGGTLNAIKARLAAVKRPPDILIHYRGSVEQMEKAFSSFRGGLILAVVLLYLVMVAQFRSFIDPFIIMFAVPMGLIGVIWTLWLTSTTLNIESFMGVIMMVGIVVSNSILLVDFCNVRRRGGQELRRAVVDAARIRMRPILMTALATVAGLLPIALGLGAGSEASAPLARAAAGGLAVSTFLTLFLVPAVYELIYSRRRS
jgi:multidrug efflux pump subunit AcrB